VGPNCARAGRLALRPETPARAAVRVLRLPVTNHPSTPGTLQFPVRLVQMAGRPIAMPERAFIYCARARSPHPRGYQAHRAE
jgi:hypothetical protein